MWLTCLRYACKTTCSCRVMAAMMIMPDEQRCMLNDSLALSRLEFSTGHADLFRIFALKPNVSVNEMHAISLHITYASLALTLITISYTFRCSGWQCYVNTMSMNVLKVFMMVCVEVSIIVWVCGCVCVRVFVDNSTITS